jgi:alkylhydroperoxidase/carboxymuconolactone decarboxylase family protein YurZ
LIQTIERIEEGSLPRDLFIVTMKRTVESVDWQTDNPEEKVEMKDVMKDFQTYLDTALAPGRLELKTKQLVGLGAALAAGCDP